MSPACFPTYVIRRSIGEVGRAPLNAECGGSRREEALARFGRPELFNTDQGSQFMPILRSTAA
jgi:hypothetical protein